jgi:alkylation response protein AidB-like acyl-CoA dehydrogenase
MGISILDAYAGPTLDPAEWARLDEMDGMLAEHADPEDEFPRRHLEALAQHGFLFSAIPPAHGGSGCSLTFAARVIEALGAVSGSLAWLMSTQYGLHFLLPTITKGAAPYFDDIVAQGALLAGAPGRSGVTIAWCADDVEVSGVLRYCSGAPVARWITTTGEVEVDGAGEQGCTVFIRADTPGIRCEPAAGSHAMRGSLSGFVYLDRVRVPRSHVHLFRDLSDPASRPADARYFGGWPSLTLQNAVFLGLARGAVATALPFLRKRAGGELDRGLIEAALGAATTDLLVARGIYYGRLSSMERAAAQRREQAESAHPAHAAVLGTAANLAHGVVARLMEQLGGSALIAGGGLERIWRDVQLARVADGNRRDANQALLGRQVLTG